MRLPCRPALLGVFALLAAPLASAAPWPRGAHVQASPTQLDQHWQDCVVAGGPEANDMYRVDCGGTAYSVPGRWIRAAPDRAPVQGGAIGGSARVTAPSATPPTARPVPPARPMPTTRPVPAGGAGGRVAPGAYECWGNGAARMLLNFEVTGDGTYTASDGSAGRFTFDPASKRITFTGFLADVMPTGFTSIYHEPKGRPTVSFRGPSGSEASFCEHP